MCTVLVEKIEQSKRHIPGVQSERGCRGRAGQLCRLGGDRMRAQFTEGTQLSLAVDLLRRLGHRRQHAADPGDRHRGIGHRAVGHAKMRLLDEALSIHEQEQVVAGRRGTAVKRLVGHRTDDVPDLRPALARRVAPSPEGACHRAPADTRRCRAGCTAVPTTAAERDWLCRRSATVEDNAGDQPSTGPSGVDAQSIDRISAPASPPPARHPGSGRVGSMEPHPEYALAEYAGRARRPNQPRADRKRPLGLLQLCGVVRCG